MSERIQISTLIRNLYGLVTTEVENPITASVGVAATRILPNNPNRATVLITNLSANNIYIGLTQAVSATNGIFVAPNGGSIVLQWDKDFLMQTRELWAIAGGAGSAIYILENVIA